MVFGNPCVGCSGRLGGVVLLVWFCERIIMGETSGSFWEGKKGDSVKQISIFIYVFLLNILIPFLFNVFFFLSHPRYFSPPLSPHTIYISRVQNKIKPDKDQQLRVSGCRSSGELVCNV